MNGSAMTSFQKRGRKWEHLIAAIWIFALISFVSSCSRVPDNPRQPVSPEKIPVATVPIRPGTIKTFRTIPGRVTFDPRFYRRVMARVSAISTIRLRAFPGDSVRRGEVVAILKSPDFLAAESELVSVLNNRGGKIESPDSLLFLAKNKLVYMGASRKEIRRLMRTRRPSDRYEVRSPMDGTIVKTGEIEGSQVHPGDVLFEVSDLHHLWVKAFIYPGEEGRIRRGSLVWVRTLHPPVHQVQTTVEQVSPMVDPMTRTIPIRIALANPGLSFEPDLWVSVLIPKAGFKKGPMFVVPARAIFENRYGKPNVIVRNRSGGFRRVTIQAVASSQGEAAVSGNFLDGDQAVTDGLNRMRSLIR